MIIDFFIQYKIVLRRITVYYAIHKRISDELTGFGQYIKYLSRNRLADLDAELEYCIENSEE